ncbi:MAG: hypothetical protein ACSHXF_16915 [Aquaticitalea sp.]
MKEYNLEKWTWTDADFDEMGWHDCPIYAVKFDDKVVFDIDYILKWNEPKVKGMSYTFWISPATLIFENVSLFKMNFMTEFVNGLEIDGITKSDVKNSTEWIIETQEGEITIHSKGFKQIIKREPNLQFGLSIPEIERGNEHFSELSDKNYRHSKEILQNRKVEFDLYELANERATLKIELEKLNRKNHETKEYLIIKREIDSRIEQLNKKLNGTRF